MEVGGRTFFRRTLGNGLQAIAVELPPEESASGATVFVAYAVGKRMEGPATTGLAHLTEHAMYSGTPTTPAGEHDQILESLEAESNAFTREDYTLYYDAGFPPEQLGRVLALEADRMRNLDWGRDAVLHERYRLEVEETHSASSSTAREELVDSVAFRRHPYGAGVVDEAGHTRAPRLGLDQIRAFYDRYYHPNRAAVVVVTPGEPEDALDRIEAAFGSLPSGPPALELPTEEPFGSGRATFPSDLLKERVVYTWVGPAREEPDGGPRDRIALTVLAWCLGRRDAPSAAGVVVHQGDRIDRDRFSLIGAGDGAEGLLESLARGAREEGVTNEELAQAKSSLSGRHDGQGLVGRPYFSLGASVATYAALGAPGYPQLFEHTLAELTLADVQNAAQKWLDPAAQWVVTFLPSETAGENGRLPEDPRELAELAERLQASGEFLRAAEIYEELARRTEDRKYQVIYLYSAGSLFRDLGETDKARAALKRALEIVDYPAVRELLEEMDADEARGRSTSGKSKPQAELESSAAQGVGSEFGVIPDAGLSSEVVAEAEELMGRIEAWRGLAYQHDVRIELTEDQAEDESLAGFYDPETKRLVVHGGRSETFARGTLLHELVHALQDQHWDLAKLHAEAAGLDSSRALSALIEGEAMLAVSELMNYDFLSHADLTPAGELDEARFGKIFRYGEGMRFVMAIRARGGWQSVDQAWSAPPRTTAEILAPERYDADTPHVLNAATGEGEAQGAYGVYLWLARSESTRGLAGAFSARLSNDAYSWNETDGARWKLQFESELAATEFAALVESAARDTTCDYTGGTVCRLHISPEAPPLPR